MTKRCSYCKEYKDVSQFSSNGQGLHAYCKPCQLVYKRSIYRRAVFDIEEIEGEIWKSITGFEGSYSVSNKGRVKSHGRPINDKFNKVIQTKILTPRLTKWGYLIASLSKNGNRKAFAIHRLVAKAYIPNLLHKRCINHIDCDKKNNCVENLEWVTHGENQSHAYRNNLRKSNKGMKYGKRKAA